MRLEEVGKSGGNPCGKDGSTDGSCHDWHGDCYRSGGCQDGSLSIGAGGGSFPVDKCSGIARVQ